MCKFLFTGLEFTGFMATTPKIADNEMNYFQYKAHEMLLLKKEDCEWKKFCEQIAPECAACSAEKQNSNKSKDIGVQAFPGKSDNKTEKTVFRPKSQNDKIPETLENIKIRLEKIDLALTKLSDVSYENEEVMKPTNASILHNEKVLKSFEEEKKLLIQKSLKASLQKLHNSSTSILKKPSPAIKLKNSGYFLPHELKVERAAARKAYLLSLQNKPKVSFKNVTHSSKKNASQKKKNVPKYTPKPKKKAIANKEMQESNVDNEETLIAAFKTEDAKDENMEQVIDGILEDLLGETAFDLNKIKQRKLQRGFHTQMNEAGVNKEEETAIPSSSLTSALTKSSKPKVLTNDASNSITKLKDFFYSPKKSDQMSINLKKEGLMDKNINTFCIEDSKNVSNEIATKKRDNSTLHKTISEVRNPLKFECSVSNIIMIDPEKARNISLNKERFGRYLKKISQTVKGAFNPWILNEVLSESILDECINDIAGELNEMSSNFIQYLYNQEFVQQVVN